MKILGGIVLGAALLAPAALQAQAAPASPAATATAPTPGATIYDSAGAVIGTVDQVTPQAVVVNVDNAKVSLPPASIGSGPQGLRVALTRAQVVSAAQQAQAGAQQQLQAQLTPGATIRGAGGAVVGTVKEADAQYVTLTTPKGDVKLPINGFGMGVNGPVIGLTAAQLDAAMTQAGGSASTSADATAGAETAPTATTGAAAAPNRSQATTRPRRQSR